MVRNGYENQWHLDRRVPISLIFTIFLQTAAAFWWAAGVNERVAQNERRLQDFAVRTETTQSVISKQGSDISALIAQIASTNKALDRLYTQMDATNTLLREMIAPGEK